MNHRRGFTLLELSIVLVIVGLLMGGVLVGQVLIRVSEINEIHKQYQEIVTAIATFKGKYNCLPGDCAKATEIFGAYDPAGDCPLTDTPPGAPTCDGNGDGWLMQESPRVWQQLAAAGLIGGAYSGAESSAVANLLGTLPGYNCPPILSNDFCWSMGNDSVAYSNRNTNLLYTLSRTWGVNPMKAQGMFTSREAQLYDTKFDDGSADTGVIQAQNFSLTGAGCTALVAGTHYVYDLTHSQPDSRYCGLAYSIGF